MNYLFLFYVLQIAVTYKIPIISKSFIVHCQNSKKMGECEIPNTKNITIEEINKFIENIKKYNPPQYIDLDSWDDGEVER